MTMIRIVYCTHKWLSDVLKNIVSSCYYACFFNIIVGKPYALFPAEFENYKTCNQYKYSPMYAYISFGILKKHCVVVFLCAKH